MKGNPDLNKNSPDRDAQIEKRKLLNQIASLQKRIYQLKDDNSNLQNKISSTIDDYEQRLSKMRNDLSFILTQKENHYQKQISDFQDNYFLIPQKIIKEHKYLYELILYSMGNSPSTDFLNFCNLIHTLNHNTYSVLQDFLPIIPERTMYDINSPEKNEIQDLLTNVDNIPKILSNFYPNSTKENKTHLTLGGDAASVKLIPESGKTAVYSYMAIPQEKEKKSIPLHLCPTNNGTSNKSIVEKLDEIIFLLEKEEKFVVDFIATDGDSAFDKILEQILNDQTCYKEKVRRLKDITHIPVSDFLHLLKNARSHLLNHIMMVDPDSLKCVNMSLFQEITQISNAINDKSSISAQKDSYALELFSWTAFEKLLTNKHFEGALYVLPFCYLIQAVCSQNLNRDERLTLLEFAVHNFYDQLRNVRKSKPTDFFTPSFTENSLGTLFGEEIFIIRCINTCFAFSIALFKYENVAFSRIGTHNIENYFGKIRLLSHFNYSFTNFLRGAVNTILLNRILNDLNYKL